MSIREEMALALEDAIDVDEMARVCSMVVAKRLRGMHNTAPCIASCYGPCATCVLIAELEGKVTP